MSHGFDFQIVINGAATDSDAPTKPRADRYRVTRKNYYNPANPVDPRGRAQCVRCNEILGARQTILFANAHGELAITQDNGHGKMVRMGVFCAVTALEDGETMGGTLEEEEV